MLKYTELVIKYIVLVGVMVVSTDKSMSLMNQKSTIDFWAGLCLLAVGILGPIEIIIRDIIKNKVKNK